MGTVALAVPVDNPGPEGVFVAPAFDGAPVGRVRRLTVTFSASYATGGDTVPVATLGLRNVNRILVEPFAASAPGFQSGISIALGGTSGAPKLLAYDAVGTEVANLTNLSNRLVTVWFVGD